VFRFLAAAAHLSPGTETKKNEEEIEEEKEQQQLETRESVIDDEYKSIPILGIEQKAW
jgi:hypothetical protein